MTGSSLIYDETIGRGGNRVYVTNRRDGTVSVIDTATNTVTSTIPVGSDPYGVAVSPDGSFAYVSHLHTTSVGDDTVSVIDTATDTIVATIPIGASGGDRDGR